MLLRPSVLTISKLIMMLNSATAAIVVTAATATATTTTTTIIVPATATTSTTFKTIDDANINWLLYSSLVCSVSRF